MANSLKDVKDRITATKNTMHITKAMMVVSQAKVRQALQNHNNYKDYLARITEIISHVLKKAGSEYTNPLLEKRPVKKTLYLLVTTDRGLVGSYNAFIFKEFHNQIANLAAEDYLSMVIGRIGNNYLRRYSFKLLSDEVIHIRDNIMFYDIDELYQKIIKAYVEKEIDEVKIIYNHFINFLQVETRCHKLLPLESLPGDELEIDYNYENGIKETLDLLLPMYVEDKLFGILLDSKTSEHQMRQNAMKNASDNASEVITRLELLYNKTRQQAITSELIDVVNGSNV